MYVLFYSFGHHNIYCFVILLWTLFCVENHTSFIQLCHPIYCRKQRKNKKRNVPLINVNIYTNTAYNIYFCVPIVITWYQTKQTKDISKAIWPPSSIFSDLFSSAWKLPSTIHLISCPSLFGPLLRYSTIMVESNF